VLLLSWAIRSLVPNQPIAAGATPNPGVSFEARVRQGNICAGPLALAHGFDVFLTNPEKTAFVTLDAGKTIGELRSFTWSSDGKRLAILGNTTGRGNIYLTDPAGAPLQPVLSNSELGYVMDAAWSRDGKKFVIWTVQNNKLVYLLNVDGSRLIEKQLDMQIFSTPQFAPDGTSIIFYGADASSSGLFEVGLEDSHIRIISPLVEDETGFAFSPEGSHLAYVEMDRTTGEARLVMQEIATGTKAVLGILPIPKGSGSSIPESANLSWSADGKSLVFDFGRGASDRAIYLAYVDGTGLFKAVDSARTPAISPDRKCLSYISDKQVFILDLTGVSLTPTTAIPMLLGDLPTGRSIADYRLDKLQWKP
jgi:Tol biopolymer transport system component